MKNRNVQMIHDYKMNIQAISLLKKYLDLKLWGTLKHFYWAC